MKILLIEPPFERFIGQKCEWYPMGLTSIATVLEQDSHTARVYNAEHDNRLKYINFQVYLKNYHQYEEGLKNEDHPIWQEITNTIQEFAPDVLGIACKSVQLPSALKIAKIGKRINRETKVVAGGAHPTIRPADLLNSDNIDIVIRGEGEKTFQELVEKFNTGNCDFKYIRGISFKNSKGDFINNPKRPLITSLDVLPYPKRELIIGYDEYTSKQLSWVMTSRGCPYDCAFCNAKAMWSRRTRFISLTNVLKELDYLIDTFEIKNFAFMDDSFTVNRKRVLEFCKILTEKKKGITWSCLTRADLISEKIIKEMKKAGCSKIDIGVESGSERIQKIITKGVTTEEVKKASIILRKYGIFWTGFFMMGFPSETKEDILATLKAIKELKPNWVSMSIFTPYPGSRLYDIAKKEGMISEDDNTIYSHQSPNNCFPKDIPKNEYKLLTNFMFNEINKYNGSILNLSQRALTRKYHKNPQLIANDLKKVWSWLRH